MSHPAYGSVSAGAPMASQSPVSQPLVQRGTQSLNEAVRLFSRGHVSRPRDIRTVHILMIRITNLGPSCSVSSCSSKLDQSAIRVHPLCCAVPASRNISDCRGLDVVDRITLSV
jgi:hypothetical protein